MGDPAGLPGGDGETLRAGYETLRAAVVSRCPDGWRHGHGVLVQEGMAGWMATWAATGLPATGTKAPQPSDPQVPSTATPPSPPSALSSLSNAGEVVAVLAQMTLAHL